MQKFFSFPFFDSKSKLFYRYDKNWYIQILYQDIKVRNIEFKVLVYRYEIYLTFSCFCEILNILILCSLVVVVVIVVCKVEDIKKQMRGRYFMFTLKTFHIAGIWQVKYSCIMWRFTSLNIIIKGLSFNPVYYKCYQKFENPTFIRTYIHYV